MNSTVDEDGTVTTRLLSTTADDGTVTTVSTGTSTDNETFSHRGSKTDSGSESLDNTSTTTELGFETNTVTDVTTVSRTNEKEGTETFRGTNAGSSTGRDEEIYQGRHESVADILPRAISAIVSSNDLKWLVDQCLTCFDCYSPM